MTKGEILLALQMDPTTVKVKNIYFKTSGSFEGYPIYEMENGDVKFPMDVGLCHPPNIMWLTVDEWTKNFDEATKDLPADEKDEILKRIKSRNNQ